MDDLDDQDLMRDLSGLNFTPAQYSEAKKRGVQISSANQLFTALLEVSQATNLSLPPDDNTSNLIESKTNGLSNLACPDRESSSSCYSSLTSFQSHESLASSTNNLSADRSNPRKIYIDGLNVAKTHGKNVNFSWYGIQICVEWFRARNHYVKVFIPQDKCETIQKAILDFLKNDDLLAETPIGCNDDMFVIIAASKNNGIIVSNDMYRDETRSDHDLRNYVDLNRLPYIFVDDTFIPAHDPIGRFGPKLDDFLLNGGTRMCNQNTTSNYRRRNGSLKEHRTTNLQQHMHQGRRSLQQIRNHNHHHIVPKVNPIQQQSLKQQVPLINYDDEQYDTSRTRTQTVRHYDVSKHGLDGLITYTSEPAASCQSSNDYNDEDEPASTSRQDEEISYRCNPNHTTRPQLNRKVVYRKR